MADPKKGITLKVSGRLIALMKHDVREGDIIPFWYGLAYRDFARDIYVFMPLPLNIIVRASREIYWLCKKTWNSKYEDYITEQTHTAYLNGKEEGERLGRTGNSLSRYHDRLWSIDQVNKVFSEHIADQTTQQQYNEEVRKIINKAGWQTFTPPEQV